MKAQLSLEFLVISVLSVVYLTSVLALHSSVRDSLEQLADKQVISRVAEWVEFVAGRPEGTHLKLQVKVYPRRWLEVSCGGGTLLATPTSQQQLDVASECSPVMLEGEACLLIESTGGGVKCEKC